MTARSLALCLALLAACALCAAPARAAGPSADYKIEADNSEKSPDGQTVIEQYHREDKDQLVALVVLGPSR